jgi:hypothetical protein
MVTFLCFMTFGMECPNSSDINFHSSPAPIVEEYSSPIPEPGAAILFAVGLGLVSQIRGTPE